MAGQHVERGYKTVKTVFIDRDGVVNKDPGGWTEHSYVTKWEDFHFLPGAKEAIKKLNDKGYEVVIVSNQAGISKGFYSPEELEYINEKMLKEIEDYGGKVVKTYYCVHQDSDLCDCRKPKTGLFKEAEKELGVKIRGSYFIGDGIVDAAAGKKAGLKTILVLSGKTKKEDIDSWEFKPDYIFKDLPQAVNFILKENKRVFK